MGTRAGLEVFFVSKKVFVPSFFREKKVSAPSFFLPKRLCPFICIESKTSFISHKKRNMTYMRHDG